MHVTFFYAALFGLLFVALSVRTLRLRVKLRIAIGDAANQQMLRAIQVHSNFAEYDQENENPRWRILGTALTLGTIVFAAIRLLT